MKDKLVEGIKIIIKDVSCYATKGKESGYMPFLINSEELATAIAEEFIHKDSIKLPEEKYIFQDPRSYGHQRDLNDGYNQCLKDIKELNKN